MTEQADETLYDFLDQRERVLENQLSALRGQVAAHEEELAHVQSAKREVARLGGKDARLGSHIVLGQLRIAAGDGQYEVSGSSAELLKSSPDMTIKDLIIRALMPTVNPEGATTAQIREFIRDAYGRDVERNSLAPQLFRLKAEGKIEQVQEGEKTLWRPINIRVPAGRLTLTGHPPTVTVEKKGKRR